MFVPKAHHRLQIHAIKTYAASNLNRDDLGAPKEVIFGGTRRLRVSSQGKKRSVRTGEVFASFRKYAAKEYGSAAMVRTRQIATLIRERMKEAPAPIVEATVDWALQLLMGKALQKKEEAKKKAAEKAAKEGKVYVEEDNGDNTQLIALSERELDIVCEAAAKAQTAQDVAKVIKETLADRAGKNAGKLAGEFSVEVQLFGRMMTAAEGFEGIDSPLQVSHAMTTHTASIQRDYWTGVDDITEAAGQQGSGHIDVRKFGSGTFYFYACLDIDLLAFNIVRAFPGLEAAKMRALVRDTALAWLQGMALQNPTGYQNSFAANDIPSAMAVELGAGFPYSAAKAFEKPVDTKGDGYERPSVERLVAWDQHRRTAYAGYVAPIYGYGLIGPGSEAESKGQEEHANKKIDLSTAPGLHELVKQVSEQLDTIIADIDLKGAA